MDEMDASQYYDQSTIHSDINIVQLSLVLTVKITHINIHTNAKKPSKMICILK